MTAAETLAANDAAAAKLIHDENEATIAAAREKLAMARGGAQ